MITRRTMFVLLVCFAMVVTMTPLQSTYAATEADYALYYNSTDSAMHKNSLWGEEVSKADLPGWSGDGKTLTLNGINFHTSATECLVVPEDMTIVVEGKNNVLSSSYDGNIAEDNYGIRVSEPGELSFEGTGDLTVLSGNPDLRSYGISSPQGSISFNGTGTITTTGGKTYISIGVHAQNAITISGATIVAKGGEARLSYGVLSKEIIVKAGSKLTGEGGKSPFSNGDSAGLYSNGGITLTDSDVKATGGPVGIYNRCISAGIRIYGNLSISGGKLESTGGDSILNMEEISPQVAGGGKSVGIIADNAFISTCTIDIDRGGLVTAKGGASQYGYSVGIATNIFNFDDGVVAAIGNQSAKSSFGIYSTASGENSLININSTGLTAKGSTVALYCGIQPDIQINSEEVATQDDGITQYNIAGTLPENLAANFDANLNTLGSTAYDGSNPETYKKANNNSYKSVATVEKAETPKFSPEEGTYQSKQNVTLSSATTGAKIYYTVDGTTPKAGVGTTKQYDNSPITVEKKETTIKAYAVADGFADSEVATATYKIESPADDGDKKDEETNPKIDNGDKKTDNTISKIDNGDKKTDNTISKVDNGDKKADDSSPQTGDNTTWTYFVILMMGLLISMTVMYIRKKNSIESK